MSEKIASYSTLFEHFAGSYVTIAVKSLRGASSNKKITNVMIAGYLLDECHDYFYIGDTPTEVYAAVRKDDVISIMSGGEDNDIELPEGQGMQ